MTSRLWLAKETAPDLSLGHLPSMMVGLISSCSLLSPAQVFPSHAFGASKWRFEVDDLKVGDLVITYTPVPKRALIIAETQDPDWVNVLWFETGNTRSAKKSWFQKVEVRGA